MVSTTEYRTICSTMNILSPEDLFKLKERKREHDYAGNVLFEFDQCVL